PCFKKTNCCQYCTSSYIDRLDLALQLKLRCAVKRLLKDNREQFDEVARLLIEHNAFETYKDHCWCAISAQQFHDIAKETCGMKKDNSDDLAPINVALDFPDARTVSVSGVTFLVSSSTLSFHSDTLRSLFASSSPNTEAVDIDVAASSFITLMNATVGIFPEECSGQLLDDLVTMGASHLHEYCVEKIKREIIDFPSVERTTAAIELVKHYHKQSTLNRQTLDSVTSSLSNDELRTLLSQFQFLPDQLRIEVEAELLHESHPITINVKTLAGKTITLSLEMAPRTAVFVIKKMIQDCENISWEQQRLIFSGEQLENDRSMVSYRIQDGSTLHLVLKLRC
ncbi:hypothetical protein PFISCL1PPCAC_4831, partial [Pristionchus fissidentatus]